MITSLTMLSGSPTLERATKCHTKCIDSIFMDHDDREFPMEITYSHSDHYSWDKWEVTAWGIEYEILGVVNASEAEILDHIRDRIREEERCTVIFE